LNTHTTAAGYFSRNYPNSRRFLQPLSCAEKN